MLIATLSAFLATSAILAPLAVARGNFDPRAPSFAAEVSALLQKRCVSCHGETSPSGGLRLDSYVGVMRGGERGPVIVPADPTASLLYRKVTHQDRPFMPPRKFLPPTEIALLRAWIQAGAAE